MFHVTYFVLWLAYLIDSSKVLKVGGKQKTYQMWQAGISLAASPLANSSRASPALASRQLRRLRVNSNKIAFFFKYRIWMVRQALLFNLKWSLNLSCNPRLLRKIDYNGNFFKPVVGLLSGTRVHMMTVGRFVVSVLRSSLPAVLSMSVIQPREKEKCASLDIMLGFHAFILVFYFHLVNLFWFLGKLTTGRPWPTPWPTPGFVPTHLFRSSTFPGNFPVERTEKSCSI